MKILILIIFYLQASETGNLNFLNYDNSNYCSFRSLISYIDIETEPYQGLINYKNVSKKVNADLLSKYLNSNKIEIMNDNVGQFISLKFGVRNDITIQEIKFISSFSEKKICELYPKFEGVLFIEFYYSSKSNSWLKAEIPPPPAYLKVD
uniref:hypothetical protein n=1 Tax=Flavobacterium sp. TaxID=239 RepID=UPI00404A45BF